MQAHGLGQLALPLPEPTRHNRQSYTAETAQRRRPFLFPRLSHRQTLRGWACCKRQNAGVYGVRVTRLSAPQMHQWDIDRHMIHAELLVDIGSEESRACGK